MVRFRFCATASLVVTSLAFSNVSANIVNGSFESGAVYWPNPPAHLIPGVPAPWFATAFTPDCYDNTGIDGWDLLGHLVYDNMFRGLSAHDGNRFVAFAAGFVPNGNVSFSEAFAQTVSLTAGQSYTLSACMAVDDTGRSNSNFGGPYTGRGTVDVLLNSSLIGTFSANTATLTWEQRSVNFVAPVASSYTLEFVVRQQPGIAPAGADLPSFIALDSIVIPEPTTVAALMLSSAMLLRRR